MLEKVAAIYPKAAVGAMNTEELWQLCAGEEERTPALNPVITLSEIKLTITPAFTSHAMSAISPTSTPFPPQEPRTAQCCRRRFLEGSANQQ
jgi:hypothetical protein